MIVKDKKDSIYLFIIIVIWKMDCLGITISSYVRKIEKEYSL